MGATSRRWWRNKSSERRDLGRNEGLGRKNLDNTRDKSEEQARGGRPVVRAEAEGKGRRSQRLKEAQGERLERLR